MIGYPFPDCIHRGTEVMPGRWECKSPLLLVPEGHVPMHACSTCHVRNRRPEPDGAPINDLAGQCRHLVYHLYPRGEEWRINLSAIAQRISLFNGRRIMAVALDDTTAPFEEVKKSLPSAGIEWLPFQNNPELWEMTAYPTLMREMAKHTSSRDVHFYAHGKGATSCERSPVIGEWRNAMYHHLLDCWPLVERELRDRAAVGMFARPGHIIPGSSCAWHFSGNFSWRRNADLFSRKWDEYDHHYCGAESHLGRVFSRGEVRSLVGDHAPGGLDLYLPEVWASGLRDQLGRHEALHQGDYQLLPLVSVLLTAHAQSTLVHYAIESVRASRCSSWELLIIDSGRIYAEGGYERYYDDARIGVFLTGETARMRKQHAMQGWAINRAMLSGLVRGEVLLTFCEDDLIGPDWIGAVARAACDHADQSVWYGPAEEANLLDDGTTEPVRILAAEGIAGPANPMRCRVDGMQIAMRRSAWVPWPTKKELAPELDGYWMDLVTAKCPAYPLPTFVGQHRHTPGSTFTKRV